MENHTYAFIVRVWDEATDDQGKTTQWRGSIDQVGGTQRLYFSDLEGITRFIREQIEENSVRTYPGWKRLLKRVLHGFRNLRNKLLS